MQNQCPPETTVDVCSFGGIAKPTLTKLEMHITLKQTTLREFRSALSFFLSTFISMYFCRISNQH